MSEHPDFENLRGLGNTWYDPSSEPNRWQSFTVITDLDQTRSEWIDMDMEMERKVNGAYEEVKELIAKTGGAVSARLPVGHVARLPLAQPGPTRATLPVPGIAARSVRDPA